MNSSQRHRFRLGVVVLLFAGLLETPLMAAPPLTYKGKPLNVWLEEMRRDLDPDYRRAAMDAVVHFGGLAIPGLAEMLNQSEDSESVVLATIALIRIGPAGRGVVGDRLAKEPRGPLLPVINGIGQEGTWTHAFIPHLRTLANSPDVSLIALRVLAQAEAAPGPGALDPLIERRWDGPGGSVFVTPLDCLVKGRFSLIRAGVLPAGGALVRQVGVAFKSASRDEIYWTPAKEQTGDGSGRLGYEVLLPKIESLGLTTLSYSVLVETSVGNVASEYVPAAISPTEEGCLMIGARPVPSGLFKGTIQVFDLGKRPRAKSR